MNAEDKPGLCGIIRGAKKSFSTEEFVGGAGEVSHLPALVIGGTAEGGAIIRFRVAERSATGLDPPLLIPATSLLLSTYPYSSLLLPQTGGDYRKMIGE
jgi:hypothetical protein